MLKKWLWGIGLAALAAGVAFVLWQKYVQRDDLSEGLASGNGRIEAEDIDLASKLPGRVKSILVSEGEFVTAGQVVAQMDTDVLQAQRREAEANLRETQNAIETAQSQVVQRQSEKAAALAVVAQREAEFAVAKKRLARSEGLATSSVIAIQQLDEDRAGALSAEAAIRAAEAQVAAADAAIATARFQVIGTQSLVKASQASIERIQADISDSALKSPRDGRVQYLVARPGEVLGAGGKVLNLLNLADVYMTFFLPTRVAGRIAMGAEVRIVLDAAPQYVIPAQVSFVADVAQFTPKTVETASEREKLMFRVKAQIPPELLKKRIRDVKTGLPGMAYVRLDPRTEWPAALQVRLPQ